jgi:hypothetical protein
MRAELAAVGLSAIDVLVEPGRTRSTTDVASAAHAVGALRVISAAQVEVLVLDSESGAVLHGEVVRAGGGADPLPLRAVETLRARLVKLQLIQADAAPGEDTPAPSAPSPQSTGSKSGAAEPVPDGSVTTPDRALPRGSSLWAMSAIGISGGHGGFGPSLAGRLGLRFDVADVWALSAFGVLPVTSQAFSRAEARAEADVYVLGATLHHQLFEVARWRGDLDLGGTLVVAAIRGETNAPGLQGRAEKLLAFGTLAGASVSFKASSHLRLRGDLQAGVTQPRILVEFDGHDVASLGRPLAIALVGAEISVFTQETPP